MSKPTKENTITLPIKGEWFDMILSGEKKEEYRKISDFYKSRFMDKDKTDFRKDLKFLRLRNGYSKKNREIVIELKRIKTGLPNPNWCPISTNYKELFFVIELGRIVEKRNLQSSWWDKVLNQSIIKDNSLNISKEDAEKIVEYMWFSFLINCRYKKLKAQGKIPNN